MSALKRRLEKLEPTTHRRLFVVTAHHEAPDSEVDRVFRDAGAAADDLQIVRLSFASERVAAHLLYAKAIGP